MVVVCSDGGENEGGEQGGDSDENNVEQAGDGGNGDDNGDDGDGDDVEQVVSNEDVANGTAYDPYEDFDIGRVSIPRDDLFFLF